MSVSKIVIFVSSLFIILFLLKTATLAQEPTPYAIEPEFVPGEVLVKFKATADKQSQKQNLDQIGVLAVEENPALETVTIKVLPGQEQSVIEQLQTDSEVEYVELNYIAYALGSPNDTSFGSQWGMTKINVISAWPFGEGDSDFIVAIVDTGIDLDHPDFSCTVSNGADKLTSGWNFVSGNSNPDDDNSHGSHVAGIIGACTNNGIGVAGTAPNVRLMPVKVLDSGGSGTYADVAAGIRHAADNGAKVINLSLGGSGNSSTMQEAVDYAVGKGVLVIAAAGNYAHQGNPTFYPAAYDNTMAVGATDSNDSWAYFSEHHAYVDVTAPGVSIYSTWSNGGYGYKNGTSMATPYVAGVAALVWSLDSTLTQEQVRQIIQGTSDDLGASGKDDYYGYGRVNAYQAQGVYLKQNNQYWFDLKTFYINEAGEPYTISNIIDVGSATSGLITWTATISPAQEWVDITSASSGVILAADTPANFNLQVTHPLTYGTYNTQIVVTGVTSYGLNIGTKVNDISLHYGPTFYFPLMFGK